LKYYPGIFIDYLPMEELWSRIKRYTLIWCC
jgi:hypothetical protein